MPINQVYIRIAFGRPFYVPSKGWAYRTFHNGEWKHTACNNQTIIDHTTKFIKMNNFKEKQPCA